jgi:hypothetical protein
VDPGLGGFLATLPVEYFTSLGLDKQDAVDENLGKHKVPTLRNVDKRPKPSFPKAYMHNGALKSLKEVVHFYNTRDVEAWPAPEVAENVNTDELGDLGLTDEEEDAIVAFMATLTDGEAPMAVGGALARSSAGDRAAVASDAPASLGAKNRIVYSVFRAGPVRIVMYDVTGRRLATLFDGWKSVGQHTLDLTATSLANGQYFVWIDADGAKQTRKVTIVR